MFTIYGIRHHGPGSALNLRRALNEQRPDCLLIEAPADAEDSIALAGSAGMTPPVALLIYNTKDLEEAVYLPFAEFSPEWQAIRYALRHDIPIRLMDLPQQLSFTLEREARQAPELDLPTEAPEPAADRRLRYDPMGYLAHLAGFPDSERWWEHTFEQYESDQRIFTVILELMTTLRAERTAERPHTLLREAHMRKVMRKAAKEGFEKVAVVCGAWHAPALADLKRYKQSEDNKLLRGIGKTKTACTWIPWSYERLAFQSGYRAGVLSPAWYEMLFRNRKEVAIRWMARTARLFRGEDLSASAAHVLEAVRLADALATLRRRPVPGIQELEEAAVSVFCEGDETPLALIRRQLVVGDVIGEVSEKIPQLPLQRDLESSIKSAGLRDAYEKMKAVDLELDLRKKRNLLASRLLHRLQLLDIPWGQARVSRKNRLGGFSEEWQLKWLPDFALRIIEAAMLGNTVEEAALARGRRLLTENRSLLALTTLLEKVLNADLNALIAPLMGAVRDAAALDKDVLRLMEALPALVRIVRYGNTRQTDAGVVQRVIDDIVPRICIGFPGACLSIDDEQAEDLLAQMLQANHAIFLIDWPEHQSGWLRTLGHLATLPQAHPLVCGAANRLLLEKGKLAADEAARRFSYHLSGGQATAAVAQWLSGFLHGSGLLLLHNPALWQLLDRWMAELEDGAFREVLPLLRRTFSDFSASERRQLLDLARRPPSADEEAGRSDQPLDKERKAEVLPVLQQIMGLK